MFLIPIEVKVLAISYAVILAIEGINMGIMGLFVIGASMLNFIVIFMSTRKGMHRTMAQRKR